MTALRPIISALSPKISSAHYIIAIRQKMDRITEINLLRFTGEFYTLIDAYNMAQSLSLNDLMNFTDSFLNP